MLGSGILKGFKETARNFFGSYLDKKRFVTIQYPEERREHHENYRSFPFLVFDGQDPVKGLRCVSCKICEKECPPQCIYIVPERDANGKLQKFPKIFDIDISVCMSCQICVEVCPFDAIKMDQEFELSNSDRFAGLLLTRAKLSKSNEYYHQIRPSEATAVDAQLAAERQRQAAKLQAASAPLTPTTGTASAPPAQKPPSPAISGSPAGAPGATTGPQSK